VARLANRAPCLWGHQEAAFGAGITEIALIVDDGATAGLMPAAWIIFTSHTGNNLNIYTQTINFFFSYCFFPYQLILSLKVNKNSLFCEFLVIFVLFIIIRIIIIRSFIIIQASER
jgi:hypothetical protein